MHQIAALLARLLAPALGVLLGLLGFATLQENLLGWLLLVAGVAYAAGTVIVRYVRRQDVLESPVTKAGNLPFKPLTLGLVGVLLLSPLEYLYLRPKGLAFGWLDLAGACIACLGGVIFVWAQRGSLTPYAESLVSTQERPLAQGGLYRFVRHPDSLGCLLTALGLAIGYGSIWGGAALLFVLVPAVLWHIRQEEQLLAVRFGAPFGEYAAKTKRLIPGVW